MNRCPITYELCGQQKYSEKGLKLLSRNLKELNDFPYTPQEQIQLAGQLAAKLSIQGVQPKLSVILNTTGRTFQIVDKGGRFILKPPNPNFEELPQNEDLTMKLAAMVGIEVPLHGMIYNIDGSLSYFIKRFDREAKDRKVAVEDFSQLSGYSRDTKYESSMEKVIAIIDKHCTFPVIERIKLFRLIIFNFLVGNEDMHLKNFSLIRREKNVELSPAYDLVNSTIVYPAKEETALPIRGKKSNLNPLDLLKYMGEERLGMTAPDIKEHLAVFETTLDPWQRLIAQSFLSAKMQSRYQELLMERWRRLRS